MTTKNVATAIAPAKFILSGEHAVVYGKPAIAVAINRYAKSKVYAVLNRKVIVKLLDFHRTCEIDLKDLVGIQNELRGQLSGEGKQDIWLNFSQDPTGFFLYGCSIFLKRYIPDAAEGFMLEIQADFPKGSGLGSSAATMASALCALSAFFDVPFTPDMAFPLVYQAEMLLHHKSSGLDPYTVLHGGCVFFKDGAGVLAPWLDEPFYLVQTGIPQASTGECVSWVKRHFETDKSIWNAFETVTLSVKSAIESKNRLDLWDAIRKNQKCLDFIGVVPEKVKRFIEEIESLGGAAKISGAGSVRGDAGGIVLVLSDVDIGDLCKRYGYEPFCVQKEPHGTRVV